MKILKKGIFIVFDGIDGAGKSEQLERTKIYLEGKGYRVCVTQEPYDPERRKRIEGKRGEKLTAEEELGIFCDDRREHVEAVIRPALDEGLIVLGSRFFDATVAYQGYGRKLDIDRVRRKAREAANGIMPDISLIFDLPAEEGLRRLQKRKGSPPDRIEREKVDFHERVRQGFIREAEWQHKQRSSTAYKIIDASLSEEKVWQETKKCIDAFFLRTCDMQL